jgi:hypothetical protein
MRISIASDFHGFNTPILKTSPVLHLVENIETSVQESLFSEFKPEIFADMLRVEGIYDEFREFFLLERENQKYE